LKRSKLIALLIIISLSLIPLVPPTARAAGSYTEKITVYVAGPNAAWFINLGGVNVTDPRIQSAEAIAGLNSYNLTAIRSTGWTADFQVFGPQGYKVLPVPYVPPEGAFLIVGAATFADANNAASKFGSYLLTTFQSIGNGSGTYSFFAPLSFSEVVPSTLFKIVPLSNGGFLAPITSASFLGLSSPIVTLSAQKSSGGGFVHQISIGSITANGLDSTSKPNILNYFGQAQASIQASNKSTSSVIDYHFLNGLVVSQDSAKIATNRTAFSSTYTLTMKPGAKLSKINATVIQQPPELLASRVVDVGVLRTGTNMSVTVTLTNLSNSTVLTNLQLNDSWWQTAGGFKLVRGNSFVSVASLDAGQTTTPTYVLQYTGNATKQLQVPATPVTFNYAVGLALQNGYTRLNPMTLSLGVDEPVVFAYVAPSSSFPTPVGANQSLKVVLKNVGTRAASSVSAAGKQVGGLAADGGSATVSLSVQAPGLTRVNVTKAYSVSYTTPAGQSLNLTTNSLPIFFAQTGVKLGLGILALNATVTQLAGGAGYNMLLTMDLTNPGPANLTSFVALTTLPPGLPCGKTSSNLTCNGSILTLSYPLVKPSAKLHASASFNVTQTSSFIFWPSSFITQSSGYLLTGYSNAQPAPTGLVLSKVFNPSVFFPGMVSQITALARNGGPFTLFNATLTTTADGFDSLSSSATTTKSTQSLEQGGNLTLSYSASIGNSKGSQSATPATAKFYLGGTPFTISSSSSGVTLNRPVSATITTSPSSPAEGTPFTVTITLTNPSSVAVAGVKFLLPIPSGVKVSNLTNSCDCASIQNGGLSISAASLAPDTTTSAQFTVSASSGETIPFHPSGSLTFVYSSQTLNGTLPTGGIAIAENVTTRYLLPIGMAVLALFVVAYEVRKMAAPTAPASQK
jgi:hypothetical protein